MNQMKLASVLDSTLLREQLMMMIFSIVKWTVFIFSELPESTREPGVKFRFIKSRLLAHAGKVEKISAIRFYKGCLGAQQRIQAYVKWFKPRCSRCCC